MAWESGDVTVGIDGISGSPFREVDMGGIRLRVGFTNFSSFIAQFTNELNLRVFDDVLESLYSGANPSTVSTDRYRPTVLPGLAPPMIHYGFTCIDGGTLDGLLMIQLSLMIFARHPFEVRPSRS